MENTEKHEILTSEKSIHRTVIVEWVTILGTIIGCFGILYAQINNLDAKLTTQCQRTDKLYEMYATAREDSIKQWSEMRKESDQKFYDLLKERK